MTQPDGHLGCGARATAGIHRFPLVVEIDAVETLPHGEGVGITGGMVGKQGVTGSNTDGSFAEIAIGKGLVVIQGAHASQSEVFQLLEDIGVGAFLHVQQVVQTGHGTLIELVPMDMIIPMTPPFPHGGVIVEYQHVVGGEKVVAPGPQAYRQADLLTVEIQEGVVGDGLDDGGGGEQKPRTDEW